jgi:hypothetical protein
MEQWIFGFCLLIFIAFETVPLRQDIEYDNTQSDIVQPTVPSRQNIPFSRFEYGFTLESIAIGSDPTKV